MSNKWINEMAQQMRSGEWKEGEDPDLYCAKFREKPCDIIEIAKGLSGQLKETVERLPADLDWDDDTS